MNVVRDCPAARWLPSRHHFALTRLLAFLRAHAGHAPGAPQGVDHFILVIDADQSAIENYAVSLWLAITIAWYLTVLSPLPIAAAALPALLLAPIVAQLPLYFIGAVLVPFWNRFIGGAIENNQRLNSVALMTLLAAASAFLAGRNDPVRYAAWFFFAVVALNAIASVILWPLRSRIRKLEERCGV